MKDGYRNKCKKCQSTHYKEYSQTENGKIAKRKSVNRYFQTEKGKNARKRASKSEKTKIREKNYHLQYPERLKAKSAVNHAIEARQLQHTNNFQCSCGKQAQQYHHHKGYAPEHWLDVIPVCVKCHRKYHKRNKI